MIQPRNHPSMPTMFNNVSRELSAGELLALPFSLTQHIMHFCRLAPALFKLGFICVAFRVPCKANGEP